MFERSAKAKNMQAFKTASSQIIHSFFLNVNWSSDLFTDFFQSRMRAQPNSIWRS
jgi:hypothetical protein